MKSKFIMFLFCLVSCLNMQAQNAPTSVEYRKEHDFFLNVIANKKFTIYDFLCVGFRSRNTSFESEQAYKSSEKFRRVFTENMGKYDDYSVHIAYLKTKAAWKAFLQVENVDLNYYGRYLYPSSNSYMRLDPCLHPEILHKLKVVPLQLKEY